MPISKSRRLLLVVFSLSCLSFLSALLFGIANVSAQTPPPPNPQSSSVGVEATLGAAPPTRAATINSPVDGQAFTINPVTVSGTCQKGLLIKVFSNNVFIGSAQCTNGSYSLQVDLFNGRDDIIVRVYDNLDQAGPDSKTVTVTMNNALFNQFGAELTLTSTYAKRGANPGQELDWPIVLAGGTGPYALSVDWGDGHSPELVSSSFSGTITVKHTYSTSGIFTVVVRATDQNGQIAYLQLVGVSNGPIAQNGASSSGNQPTTLIKTEIIWWPSLALVPLLLVAFWLGRRHELFSLRKQLERSTERQ